MQRRQIVAKTSRVFEGLMKVRPPELACPESGNPTVLGRQVAQVARMAKSKLLRSNQIPLVQRAISALLSMGLVTDSAERKVLEQCHEVLGRRAIGRHGRAHV